MPEPQEPAQLILPQDAWQQQPAVAGGGPGVPAVRDVQPAAVVLPPDQFAPPLSQPLYALGASAAPLGPGPAAVLQLPGSRIQLQAGQTARIETWYVQVLGMVPTALVTMTLLVNNAPWPGCRRLLPAGPLAVAAFSFPVYVVTPPGASIVVVAQVDDAGAYTISSFYSGWVYNAAAQQRYYAAVSAMLS